MKIKQDLVPQCSGGVLTLNCNECKWETSWIVPEEYPRILSSLIEHIQQHGIEIPQFVITTH